MIKRTISLLLCLVLMFTLFAGCDTPDTSSTDIVSSEPNSSSEPQDTTSSLEEAISSQTDKKTGISVPATVDKTFETLPAEYSVLLNKNPDRGFRSEDMYFVPVIDTLRANPEDYTYEKLLAKVKSNINANIGESVMVSRVYFRMSNYKDIPELPQEVYSYIDNVCKAYAEVGVKMYWEAYYQQGSYPDQGARKSVILKHLDTYGKIWEKHKDTIYAVCFGLIGGYGEWTTIGDNLYDDGIDPTLYTYEERQAMILEGKRQVAAKVLSLLPEQTYLTMRRPSQKAEAVPADHPKYDMIGFAQDAFFGKMFPSEDYGQGGWQPDNSGGWWEMSIKESPYVPNDGELYTTRYFKDNGIYVEPYSSIQVFSELHETP